MSVPLVSSHTVLRIGASAHGCGVAAVVCTLLPNSVVEVVYLNRNRAIAEDVRWDGEQWVFVREGPCGIYADNCDRLAPYIATLRKL